MKPRISMVTLGVRDLKAATEFYQQGLGLPRLDIETEAVFFNLSGTWLGLYPWSALAEDAQVDVQGSGFRGVTLSHNLASKEEVDQLLLEVQSAGAKLVKPAQDVFWGGYSGYFSDPDGHLWEVAYNPFMWVGPEDS